ncbi:MAG: hypothetical protein IH991_07590 [Planctomycetes bacterium]|nr:hypothetical protein [Planctomycetota bacterium]
MKRVILNKVKDLARSVKILRYAQNDSYLHQSMQKVRVQTHYAACARAEIGGWITLAN